MTAVSPHTRRFVYVLCLFCLFEIGRSAWDKAKVFEKFYGKDGPTYVISIFKPFRAKIPYHDRFNVLLEEGADVAVKRLAQFALAPRQLREGTGEKWLVYYSAKGLPLPEALAADRDLVATGAGGTSLYRLKSARKPR